MPLCRAGFGRYAGVSRVLMCPPGSRVGTAARGRDAVFVESGPDPRDLSVGALVEERFDGMGGTAVSDCGIG
nr:hypothetical protein GCM10020092_045370 [Actinoplanes digitatis]